MFLGAVRIFTTDSFELYTILHDESSSGYHQRFNMLVPGQAVPSFTIKANVCSYDNLT